MSRNRASVFHLLPLVVLHITIPPSLILRMLARLVNNERIGMAAAHARHDVRAVGTSVAVAVLLYRCAAVRTWM